MIKQTEFVLNTYLRGFHLITSEIIKNLSQMQDSGLLNLFIQNTSVALTYK